MRLWLLRQAHPDLSKLELEVSTSCLSKISLLRLLLGQTNRDKDFPESLRYSVRPNILSSGRGFDDQFDISQYGFHDLTGAMFISRTGPRKYDRAMYESNTSGSLAWTFDASRNSAVYGASGTNQPASIRFLCLIRSY